MCVMCPTVYMWRSEHKFGEQVLSFLHVDSRYQTQVIRLGSKPIYPLRHFTCPSLYLNPNFKLDPKAELWG